MTKALPLGHRLKKYFNLPRMFSFFAPQKKRSHKKRKMIRLLTRSSSLRTLCCLAPNNVAALSGTGLVSFHTTLLHRFNLKQHELEKRRLRELERAGIDPNDDEPWIAPEEQERIDEEAAQRKMEEQERIKKMLEERDKDELEKKKKLKEFRAKQLKISEERRKQAAAAKTTNSPAASRASRMLKEEVDESVEKKMDERGDFTDDDSTAESVEDRDERRRRLADQRRQQKSEEGTD